MACTFKVVLLLCMLAIMVESRCRHTAKGANSSSDPSRCPVRLAWRNRKPKADAGIPESSGPLRPSGLSRPPKNAETGKTKMAPRFDLDLDDDRGTRELKIGSKENRLPGGWEKKITDRIIRYIRNRRASKEENGGDSDNKNNKMASNPRDCHTQEDNPRQPVLLPPVVIVNHNQPEMVEQTEEHVEMVEDASEIVSEESQDVEPLLDESQDEQERMDEVLDMYEKLLMNLEKIVKSLEDMYDSGFSI